MLARAVDAGEGLLVQQAGQAVLLGHALQGDHDDLLVVGRHVGVLVHRGQLVLAGGHFVVAGLHRHAQLEQLALRVQHAGQHALGDGAEILVFKLLALGRLGAEQRASAQGQVGAGEEEVAVDQEVLLLRPGGGEHVAGVLVAKQLQDALGLLVQGLHGAQHRGLLVQRLARPRAERGGDAQGGAVRILQDVGRAGHVPRRVAAGLEGRADAAGGEGGRVGLALDQLLAGEFGKGTVVAVGAQEAVMLLRGDAGQGLEYVRVVGRALLNGPLFHGLRHHVGHAGVQLRALLDGLGERLVNTLGQALLHLLVIENIRAKNLLGRGVQEVKRLLGRLVGRDRRNGSLTCIRILHCLRTPWFTWTLTFA